MCLADRSDSLVRYKLLPTPSSPRCSRIFLPSPKSAQTLTDRLVRLCGLADTPALLPHIERITQAAPWPSIAEVFLALALTAAAQAGFGPFEPDACMTHRYTAGAGLGLQRRGPARFTARRCTTAMRSCGEDWRGRPTTGCCRWRLPTRRMCA